MANIQYTTNRAYHNKISTQYTHEKLAIMCNIYLKL